VNDTSFSVISDTGLTPEEVAKASRHLSVTRDLMVESVTGLSSSQWGFKPGHDTWSIAEIMEHVLLVESHIHLIIGNLNQAPEAASDGRHIEMDEFILNQIPKRTRKGKSPEHACPTNRWTGPEALQCFIESRERSSQLLVTPGPPRTCCAPSSLRPMGRLSVAVGGRLSRRQAHRTDPRSEG
jgi:hypothetical protein